jgi:predicted metal-dependent hydrolase
MRQESGKVRFGTTTISYSISRSGNRNTIAMTVHPDGAVPVVAPTDTCRTKIAEVIAKKAEWVLRQQEHFRHQHNGYAKQFVSGESFFYLGRQYKIKVRPIEADDRESPQVQLVRGQLFVLIPWTTALDTRATAVCNGLTRWYRAKARAHIPPVVARFSRRLGLSYTIVQIREMKQRWGSAGANGRLSFNWRIVMAPRRLVEYVVVHELCHLRYPNHSRDFWRLLERTMPDYERRREKLAIVGPKLDLLSTEAMHGKSFGQDYRGSSSRAP